MKEPKNEWKKMKENKIKINHHDVSLCFRCCLSSFRIVSFAHLRCFVLFCWNNFRKKNNNLDSKIRFKTQRIKFILYFLKQKVRDVRDCSNWLAVGCSSRKSTPAATASPCLDYDWLWQTETRRSMGASAFYELTVHDLFSVHELFTIRELSRFP
jgi:hypothetical protein